MVRRAFVALTLALTLALLLTNPASAGKRENEAEAKRLTQEMERLASRNHWTGVERNFITLSALASKGVDVPKYAYLLGASSAKSLGDAQSAYERLMAADRLGSDDDTQYGLAELYANYGWVELSVAASWKDPLEIASLEPSFDPTFARTIELASKKLSSERSYVGLLPIGRYRVGHERFDVDGGPKVQLALKPPKGGAVPAPEAPVAVSEPAPAKPRASDTPVEVQSTSRPAPVVTPTLAVIYEGDHGGSEATHLEALRRDLGRLDPVAAVRPGATLTGGVAVRLDGRHVMAPQQVTSRLKLLLRATDRPESALSVRPDSWFIADENAYEDIAVVLVPTESGPQVKLEDAASISKIKARKQIIIELVIGEAVEPAIALVRGAIAANPLASNLDLITD